MAVVAVVVVAVVVVVVVVVRRQLAMKNASTNQIAVKTNARILLVLALGWFACSNTYADSLSVACQVGIPKSSVSRILVRASGLKGSYYVTVFSGGDSVQSESRPAKGNGLIQFKFDSVLKPNAVSLPENFIKRKTVTGVLRNAETHARIGAIRTQCILKKPKPNS